MNGCTNEWGAQLLGIRRLVLSLLFCLFQFFASVIYAGQSGDFTYEVTTNSTITLTKYTGIGGIVVIPEKIEEFALTTIAEDAFNNCTGMTGIFMPDSVTNIESRAFFQCTGITSFTIGNGVVTIGDSAFASCANLTNVIVPQSVLSIGSGAFTNCSQLSSVFFKGNAPSLSDRPVFDLSSSARIIYPFGATGWDSRFGGLSTTVWWDEMPYSIQTIGASGDAFFQYLGNAGTFNMNDTYLTITCLKSGAFANCASLTNIKIGKYVGKIEGYAFFACSGLASISLPDSVTNVEVGAFSDCGRLTNILFGNGLTMLTNSIFSGYASLRNITFSKGLRTIGSEAFAGCTGLTSIYFQGDAPLLSGNDVFDCPTNTIVYYVPSSHGWGQTYGGLTTAVWDQSKAFGYGVINQSIIEITDYFGGGGSVTIPEIIEGLPVRRIGYSAFRDHSEVLELVIGNSVTNIGERAFYGCAGLTNVQLGNGVITIGPSAFYHCINLTDISMFSNLKTIGEQAFMFCEKITSLVIPDSVTDIGYRAFELCSGLTNIVLSENMSNIPEGLFEDCEGLEKVIIPNSVTNIGVRSFDYCLSLKTLTLSTNLVSIESWAFSYCTNLTCINLPGSLTNIGFGPFAGCVQLTNIIVDSQNPNYSDKDGVVFNKEQNSLVVFPSGKAGSYTIPEGVTQIMTDAFTGANCITEIKIGQNVTNISQGAFSISAALTNITVDSDNLYYTATNNVLFNHDQTILLQYLSANTGSYAMPDSVTNIGYNAFSYYSGLTNITLSTNLLSIGAGAFADCDGLVSLILPPKLAAIDSYAFERCSGLRSLYFTGNAPKLPQDSYGYVNNAFYEDRQLTIYHLAGTGGWNDNHFGGITVQLWGEPLHFSYSIRADATVTITRSSGQNGSITVPETLEGHPVTSIDYNAFYHCTWLTNISLPNSLTNIGFGAFYSCTSLTSLTLPEGLTTIGSSAFSSCTSLTNISIPSSVTNMGSGAFRDCVGLTSLILAEGVPTIGDSAFASCTSLTDISIPHSVTNIGNNAFNGCAGLKSLDLSEGVVTIGNSAFYSCISLTNLTIPHSVTNIGTSAFSECKSLTTLILPEGVTIIGNAAFSYCNGLTNVFIPKSVLRMGGSAFGYCRALAEVYFEGDAPAGSLLFYNDNTATVFYHPGTKGWGLSYSGVLTALWEKELPFAYNVNASSNIVIFKYIGADGSVTIPETIHELPVARIGRNAFLGRSGITDIALPNCVTNIEFNAFNGCAGLTTFTLPNSVTNVEQSAFANCTGLTNISFGNGLTLITNMVFSGCTNLTSVTIPPGVGKIWNKAFFGCSSLTNVTLPATLTNIMADAFSGCPGITGFYFEGNAPVLGSSTPFSGDTNGVVYYLPDSTGWGETFGGLPTALWIKQSPYEQWASANGLATQFPNAKGEQDDADHDGLTNLQEMNAGTDPTNSKSALAFEMAARIADLSEEDKTAIAASQFALYFQSIPGKSYDLQKCESFRDSWTTVTTVTASTTQKRILLDRSTGNAFYRVMVRQ